MRNAEDSGEEEGIPKPLFWRRGERRRGRRGWSRKKGFVNKPGLAFVAHQQGVKLRKKTGARRHFIAFSRQWFILTAQVMLALSPDNFGQD